MVFISLKKTEKRKRSQYKWFYLIYWRWTEYCNKCGPHTENWAMFGPDVPHHYFRISNKVNLRRTTVSRRKFKRSFRVIWALCRVSFHGSRPFDWVGIDIALIPSRTVHDLLIHHVIHTLVRQCLVFSVYIYR